MKLGDLGIAVEQATRITDYNFAGTLPFMPPEVFESPPRFGPQWDLYALGMTLACRCLEVDPFPVRSQSELLGWIMSDTRPSVSVLRPDIPASLGSLVERMIARDARHRGRRPLRPRRNRVLHAGGAGRVPRPDDEHGLRDELRRIAERLSPAPGPIS